MKDSEITFHVQLTDNAKWIVEVDTSQENRVLAVDSIDLVLDLLDEILDEVRRAKDEEED